MILLVLNFENRTNALFLIRLKIHHLCPKQQRYSQTFKKQISVLLSLNEQLMCQGSFRNNIYISM